MRVIVWVIWALSLAGIAAAPFVVMPAPDEPRRLVLGSLLLLAGMAGLQLWQRFRVLGVLALSKQDRVAFSRYVRAGRALYRVDLETAQRHADAMPDTPMGRALGVLVRAMMHFDRGEAAAALEITGRWLATHADDDRHRPMILHMYADFSALALFQGSADAAVVVPMLRPAVTGADGGHRRQGCLSELMLDVYEGRFDRALGMARRWRRRAGRHRSPGACAETESMIAICLALKGDLTAANEALAEATRFAPDSWHVHMARARVAATSSATLTLEPGSR
ncbi:hypothetical protein [Embleya sp. NBC_00896]|uniref:hypothetical protein n=1 Tax=Embleya sp. NBC_00896 TaxID=2975961 RepID=UPI00386E18AA|nr:hypothetical protein OG928_06765 [Embleya sp. NBC_00896]